ncbi:hypothetical protein OSB04_005753 [Centaurea solstitialis]|uniref:Uncharacterized protein n=1 Tax=Centaurea solstitialis TaxID=347529 RepID=A0AA38TGN0_9ASTR|nr:hypothetical protein OSB04_005753 [Centaurea solstitialis]
MSSSSSSSIYHPDYDDDANDMLDPNHLAGIAAMNEAIKLVVGDEATSSRQTRRPLKSRNRIVAHEKLVNDYFSDNPVYDDNDFERRFRMKRRLFLRIVADLEREYKIFRWSHDARGVKGFSPLQKCMSAIRQLAYGTAADATDEYLQMSETTSRECFSNFCQEEERRRRKRENPTMAATVTSAWAKPGAWALDSEEHEEELKQDQQPPAPAKPAAPMSDFPDLMTAAATKTKKKKGQTLSLGEFVTGKTNNKPQSYQAAKGLTAEDMMMLPTGPRQRTAEELDRTRLGGGFRSYGGGGDRNGDSSNSRWGSGRSNGDDEGRRPSREPLGPSRADEIDDWGAAKKSTIGGGGGGGFDRRERGGGFFEGSHSRADESDSWASNKSYAPSDGRRNGGGGGGFDRERRMGFESSGDADSSDNWGRKKEVEPRRFGGGGGGGSAFDSLRERRGGNDSSESDSWGKKREEVSVGGGRPKLNLQPRKLPVADGENVVVAVKPTKGSNPFGDARPREQVLKEKGEDWKEMDEKLEAMKIKDLGSGDRLQRGGSGIGRPRSNEDSTERNWRKNQVGDAPPPRFD